MLMKEEDGVWKKTKLSTHFMTGPIKFKLKMAISALAGHPWMLPDEARPSIVQ